MWNVITYPCPKLCTWFSGCIERYNMDIILLLFTKLESREVVRSEIQSGFLLRASIVTTMRRNDTWWSCCFSWGWLSSADGKGLSYTCKYEWVFKFQYIVHTFKRKFSKFSVTITQEIGGTSLHVQDHPSETRLKLIGPSRIWIQFQISNFQPNLNDWWG